MDADFEADDIKPEWTSLTRQTSIDMLCNISKARHILFLSLKILPQEHRMEITLSSLSAKEPVSEYQEV